MSHLYIADDAQREMRRQAERTRLLLLGRFLAQIRRLLVRRPASPPPIGHKAPGSRPARQLVQRESGRPEPATPSA